jgi:hypothetical protein
MATKTPEKNPVIRKGGASASAASPAERLAEDILVTYVQRALVRLTEPARISDIVAEIADSAIEPSAVRFVLDSHPRVFAAVDRRWDLTQRYGDSQRPVAKILEELVAAYGAPLPVGDAAGELGRIFRRPTEAYESVAARMFRSSHFFPIAGGVSYGLRSWLLDTEWTSPADIYFYNDVRESDVADLRSAGEAAGWKSDVVEAALSILATMPGTPLDNKVLQLFAWRALGDEFNAVDVYEAMHASDALMSLPGNRWVRRADFEELKPFWASMAERVGELPEEAAAEPVVEIHSTKPLEIMDTDREELIRYFDGLEDYVTVPELLAGIFEVGPQSRTYQDDVQALIEYLRQSPDEFVWVGTDRFRAPGTLPPYLGQIPESLTFPVLPRFETPDGEILDQQLSDEGFEDKLRDDVFFSVAQDVGDEEPAGVTIWPEGVSADAASLRLVLKAHHKEIGTFPVAQIPRGFFPPAPEIVELTLLDAANNQYPIYIDYQVGLIYGFFDVYADITIESGAVFTLEKTDDPAEYRFIYNNETDADVYVSPARHEELLAYRDEVERGPVSTYDIIRTILEHYHKGIHFLTLLTEVNIVRRTPRRLVASVLSGYTAFDHRANRWIFEQKREIEGFDKKKSRFVI